MLTPSARLSSPGCPWSSLFHIERTRPAGAKRPSPNGRPVEREKPAPMTQGRSGVMLSVLTLPPSLPRTASRHSSGSMRSRRCTSSRKISLRAHRAQILGPPSAASISLLKPPSPTALRRLPETGRAPRRGCPACPQRWQAGKAPSPATAHHEYACDKQRHQGDVLQTTARLL